MCTAGQGSTKGGFSGVRGCFNTGNPETSHQIALVMLLESGVVAWVVLSLADVRAPNGAM